ncbi:unnamed protein product [Vitrella brassicaformis CCMP3155]|uniref:PDZ GRASP-type domain-containing protein n=2 Tax=Vitrella brassicaformis TaxID=1169539 RepID=A0A0G4GEL5_VITBC|nr:unnamed protein product [Vitrella brassicaformis CCMP3155]|eukprot:CEM27830.1 unnamed protein product [Vitrella brassicaformis CCMP3155]
MGGSQSAPGGFRIFKVCRHSPAERAGLEVFFDFITEVDGLQMVPDQTVFFNKIMESEGRQIKLAVYNCRCRNVRDVYVIPSKWGGQGLLGATVRYDTFENCENQGVRVLDIFPRSPAAAAGLVPYKDWLLGTSDVMFKDLDELVETVNYYLNKPVAVYVYNSDVETIREVILTPNHNWGGDGSIGCDIGTGLLHRIPPPRSMPAQPQTPQIQQQQQPQQQTYPTPPQMQPPPPQHPHKVPEAPPPQQYVAANAAAGQNAPPPYAQPGATESMQQQHQQQQQHPQAAYGYPPQQPYGAYQHHQHHQQQQQGPQVGYQGGYGYAPQQQQQHHHQYGPPPQQMGYPQQAAGGATDLHGGVGAQGAPPRPSPPPAAQPQEGPQMAAYASANTSTAPPPQPPPPPPPPQAAPTVPSQTSDLNGVPAKANGVHVDTSSTISSSPSEEKRQQGYAYAAGDERERGNARMDVQKGPMIHHHQHHYMYQPQAPVAPVPPAADPKQIFGQHQQHNLVPSDLFGPPSSSQSQHDSSSLFGPQPQPHPTQQPHQQQFNPATMQHEGVVDGPPRPGVIYQATANAFQ